MLRIFFFGLLFLVFDSSFSQRDSIVKYDNTKISPVEISKEDLGKYLSDDKFDYAVAPVEENTWWDAVVNWFYNLFRSFFEWIFGAEEAVGYLAVFLKVLPYILLAILLFLIIRFFIKANTRSLVYHKQNPNLVTLSEEERIIKTEDIQQLIKDALAENNYRLAVRYYYLFILKLLSEKELIDWQLQKTNDDYISELSNNSLKNMFGRVTLLYDHVWYGEFHLDQERYTIAETVFLNLKNSIAKDA